jgi:hypothetical protein
METINITTHDLAADIRKPVGEKVTIYTRGTHGNVEAIKARIIAHGRRKWAQHDDAPGVTYIPKGAHYPRGFTLSPRDPLLVIVRGWKHTRTVQPDTLYVARLDSYPVQTLRARYAGNDPRWVSDFRSKLKRSTCDVIADYR